MADALECPQCQKKLRVPGVPAGATVPCPYCGSAVIVPTAGILETAATQGPATNSVGPGEPRWLLRLERAIIGYRLLLLLPLGLAAYETVEWARGRMGYRAGVPHLLAALAIIHARAQARLVMVYLGRWSSRWGIVGSPMLLRAAAVSMIVNLGRAALCFLVPWPTLLPVFVATYAMAPLVGILTCWGVFGESIADLAFPEFAGSVGPVRKLISNELVRGRAVFALVVGVVAVALWYFVVR